MSITLLFFLIFNLAGQRHVPVKLHIDFFHQEYTSTYSLQEDLYRSKICVDLCRSPYGFLPGRLFWFSLNRFCHVWMGMHAAIVEAQHFISYSIIFSYFLLEKEFELKDNGSCDLRFFNMF